MYFYGLGKLVELVLLFLIISRLNFNYFKLFISFIASIFLHCALGFYQFFSQNVLANKYLGIAGQSAYQGGVSVLEGVLVVFKGLWWIFSSKYFRRFYCNSYFIFNRHLFTTEKT